jgi:hypothetical protein
MILYRAIETKEEYDIITDAMKLESGVDIIEIPSLLLCNEDDKFYSRQLSNERTAYAIIKSIPFHVRGISFNKKSTPWLSLTKDFETAKKYATGDKCLPSENHFGIIAINVEDDLLIDDFSFVHVDEELKRYGEEIILEINAGKLINKLDNGYFLDLSNGQVEEIEKDPLYKMSFFDKTKTKNFSKADKEVLAYRQLQINRDDLIYIPDNLISKYDEEMIKSVIDTKQKIKVKKR